MIRSTLRTFSLMNLVLAIGVLCLAFAALRSSSGIATQATCSLTLAILFVALLGAIVRPSPAAAWRGFALYGWAYFLWSHSLTRWEWKQDGDPFRVAKLLPTADLVEWLVGRLHPETVPPLSPAFAREFSPKFFDGSLMQLDPKNGYRPLSKDEVLLWREYEERATRYRLEKVSIDELVRNTKITVHALFSLGFTFVGAVLGRRLARCPIVIPSTIR